MNKLMVVLKKELKRVYSDKKIMFNLFVLPLISLTVIYSALGMFLISTITDTEEHQSTIYEINMPAVIQDGLEKNNIKVISADMNDLEKHEDKIKNGEEDFMVVFAPDFIEEISQGVVSSFKTYYNEAEDYSKKAYQQFSSVMGQYEKSVLAERVGGVENLTVYEESSVQLAKENIFIIKMVSGLVTMMIVMFIFAGSMQQGIDMIAGEKERGSLATMLMTPTDRKTLAAGKVSGLSIIAVFSSFVTFIGIILALLINKSFLESRSQAFSEGIDQGISQVFKSLQFGFDKIIMLLILMIMTAIISASFICYLSSRAKTVKEAGTLISPFYIVIMIAAYIPYITQETPKFFSYFVPLYGNVASIYSLIEGTFNISSFIVCCLMTILYAGAFVFFTGKSFENEKVMF
ncbi:MAG: ABC transporter permease [Clostridia bacterium]|nr:ABC transporter permease [Clostridia bacterium]